MWAQCLKASNSKRSTSRQLNSNRINKRSSRLKSKNSRSTSNSWAARILYKITYKSRKTASGAGERVDLARTRKSRNHLSLTLSPEMSSITRSSIILVLTVRLPITGKVSRICCRWLAVPLAEINLKLNKSIQCLRSCKRITKANRSWSHRRKIARWARAVSRLRLMNSWMIAKELFLGCIDLKSGVCPCQKPTRKQRNRTVMVPSRNWLTISATWRSSE